MGCRVWRDTKCSLNVYLKFEHFPSLTKCTRTLIKTSHSHKVKTIDGLLEHLPQKRDGLLSQTDTVKLQVNDEKLRFLKHMPPAEQMIQLNFVMKITAFCFENFLGQLKKRSENHNTFSSK